MFTKLILFKMIFIYKSLLKKLTRHIKLEKRIRFILGSRQKKERDRDSRGEDFVNNNENQPIDHNKTTRI